MANNTIQLKRSSVAGKQPNTSTLAIGELALNLTDRKLYSSDGTNIFETGANLTTLSVSTNTSVNNVIITGGIYANGGYGTNSQVLTSNGSTVYWSTVSGGGSVNVAAQYTWTNTQTFSNTITFSSTINGTANNALYLGGTAAASYQLNSTLAANVATMAANSSTYSNSSVTNTFTVGTAAYHVANGNFGIGNSAPTTKLSVNGSSYFGGNITTADGTALNLGRETTDGLEGGQLNFSSGNSLNAAYPSWSTDVYTNTFRILNGGASNTQVQMFGASTGTVGLWVQGNTGIGTSSPAYKLDVTGDIRASANIYGTLATTSQPNITANNSSYLGGTAAASFVQNTDSRTLSGNLAFTGTISVTTNTNVFQVGQNQTGVYTSARFGPRPANDGYSSVELYNGTTTNKFDSTAGGLTVYANGAIHTTFTAGGALSVNGSITSTGTVNAAAHTIGSTWVANTSGVYMTMPLSANGGTGTAGYFLTSNGSTGSPYWSSAGGYYKGGAATVGAAADANNIFRINGQTLYNNTTIGATENAQCAGPLTVQTGITLTISTGGRVVIS